MLGDQIPSPTFQYDASRNGLSERTERSSAFTIGMLLSRHSANDPISVIN